MTVSVGIAMLLDQEDSEDFLGRAQKNLKHTGQKPHISLLILRITMSKNATHTHHIAFNVRDYECDMQGIVNNSVYQNYLEHARHQFIKSKGLDFSEITKNGVHLVLIKAALEYKRSLKSGDNFIVETMVDRLSRFKFSFHQKIVDTKHDTLFLLAKMTIASITASGKPVVFAEADKLFY